ncbi:hypothetical protein QQ045_016803 [Rhodiola kirilowii]
MSDFMQCHSFVVECIRVWIYGPTLISIIMEPAIGWRKSVCKNSTPSKADPSLWSPLLNEMVKSASLRSLTRENVNLVVASHLRNAFETRVLAAVGVVLRNPYVKLVLERGHLGFSGKKV